MGSGIFLWSRNISVISSIYRRIDWTTHGSGGSNSRTCDDSDKTDTKQKKNDVTHSYGRYLMLAWMSFANDLKVTEWACEFLASRYKKSGLRIESNLNCKHLHSLRIFQLIESLLRAGFQGKLRIGFEKNLCCPFVWMLFACSSLKFALWCMIKKSRN